MRVSLQFGDAQLQLANAPLGEEGYKASGSQRKKGPHVSKPLEGFRRVWQLLRCHWLAEQTSAPFDPG